MKSFVVPYALWIGDDGYVSPEVVKVEADNEIEAIKRAYSLLKVAEPDQSIWYFDDERLLDESNEEGYIIGCPVELK